MSQIKTLARFFRFAFLFCGALVVYPFFMHEKKRFRQSVLSHLGKGPLRFVPLLRISGITVRDDWRSRRATKEKCLFYLELLNGFIDEGIVHAVYDTEHKTHRCENAIYNITLKGELLLAKD